MNDRGDLQVPDYAADLMSETHAKRSKQTEGPLLIGDGTPIWLHNVFSRLTGSPTASEEAFIAVLYTIMYESGFYFIDGLPNSTVTFNARLMRALDASSLLLKKIKKEDSKYIGEFSHCLFYPNTLKVISYRIKCGYKDIMIVNFYFIKINKAYSLMFSLPSCINTIGPNEDKVELVRSGCRNMSYEIKNTLYKYKCSFSRDVYFPQHILSLPLHLLQLLCKYLDCRSFVRFIQTCSYLQDNFIDDEILWKYHSLIEYRGLTKKSNESWKVHFLYQMNKKPPPRIFNFDVHNAWNFNWG